MNTLTPKFASTQKPFNVVLGIHIGGHDSSVCLVIEGEIIEVVEFERVFRKKRYRIFPDNIRFDEMLDWLFNKYKITKEIDLVAMHIGHFRDELLPLTIRKIKQYLPKAHYVKLNHHLCHASSSYFTSPYNKACILSYDGKGNDGSTITFIAEGNKLTYYKKWPFRMGTSFRALGSIIGDIHTYDNHTAGKTMGLTAYGKIIDAWKEPIRKFIKTYRPKRDQVASWEATIANGVFYLDGFGPVIGQNTFGGPSSVNAQNFAHTFQKVWTEITIEIVRETVRETGCKNFCVVGGAALNAVTNYHISKMKELENVHFIPNPNDSGLATGAALYGYYSYQSNEWNGRKKYLSPYLGVSILDYDNIDNLAKIRNSKYISDPPKILAELISKGNIIGVIEGRSEIGPRALGNRSILCDPRNSQMKEILNQKIKGREWYRPFAPVVQEEDQAKYFDVNKPVPYMSLIGFVKEEWQLQIPSVTHVDGSARLQTVNRDQNIFLWELLEQFKRITGIGVLLNTSFNGKGEAIISKLSEALKLLDDTDLDYVYSNGWLFSKNN